MGAAYSRGRAPEATARRIGAFSGGRRRDIATQPPAEAPVPDNNPVPVTAPPPEISPPGPDIDQPTPGMPSTDPGTAQPPEMM